MDAMLTPEQIADDLRLAPHTVYTWLREGRLPGVKTGNRWRVRRADPDTYLDGRRLRAATEARGPEPDEGLDLMDLVQEIEEMMSRVPQGEWDRIPDDLCENLDHYLYGRAKRGQDA